MMMMIASKSDFIDYFDIQRISKIYIEYDWSLYCIFNVYWDESCQTIIITIKVVEIYHFGSITIHWKNSDEVEEEKGEAVMGTVEGQMK